MVAVVPLLPDDREHQPAVACVVEQLPGKLGTGGHGRVAEHRSGPEPVAECRFEVGGGPFLRAAVVDENKRCFPGHTRSGLVGHFPVRHAGPVGLTDVFNVGVDAAVIVEIVAVVRTVHLVTLVLVLMPPKLLKLSPT